MAIPHALPGQVIDVSPLGARLADERSIALFKSNDLEVMHIVLMAGKEFPLHKVAGEVTIQCVEGELLVTAQGTNCTLRAGQLLYLQRDVLHGLGALQDASALVTIALLR